MPSGFPLDRRTGSSARKRAVNEPDPTCPRRMHATSWCSRSAVGEAGDGIGADGDCLQSGPLHGRGVTGSGNIGSKSPVSCDSSTAVECANQSPQLATADVGANAPAAAIRKTIRRVVRSINVARRGESSSPRVRQFPLDVKNCIRNGCAI